MGCEAGVGGLGREEASGAHAPDTAEGGLSHGDASLTPSRPVGEEMREPGQPTVWRQRRDWRDFLSSSRHFWQNEPVSERRSRCPPVLGAFY